MRRRRHTLQVSTFPFLAVLLCAMGSLILLLLVLDRRAKVVARAKERERQEAVLEQHSKADRDRMLAYEQKRQELRQRLQSQEIALHANVDSLQAEVRRKKQETLQERSRTAELQARLRALRQVLAREQDGYEQEQKRSTTIATKKKQVLSEHEGLARELVNLEKALADVIAFRKRQAQTYSLVPFLGKSGENRRPIYVECQADQIIVHPEHLIAKTASWDGSNQVQELAEKLSGRLKANAEETKQKPYLLFLVRPEGIATYYRVFGPLGVTHIDSGYELIDADWALDFGESDGHSPGQPWVADPRAPSSGAITAASTGGARSTASFRGVPQNGVEMFGGGSPVGSRSAVKAESGNGAFEGDSNQGSIGYPSSGLAGATTGAAGGSRGNAGSAQGVAPGLPGSEVPLRGDHSGNGAGGVAQAGPGGARGGQGAPEAFGARETPRSGPGTSGAGREPETLGDLLNAGNAGNGRDAGNGKTRMATAGQSSSSPPTPGAGVALPSPPGSGGGIGANSGDARVAFTESGQQGMGAHQGAQKQLPLPGQSGQSANSALSQTSARTGASGSANPSDSDGIARNGLGGFGSGVGAPVSGASGEPASRGPGIAGGGSGGSLNPDPAQAIANTGSSGASGGGAGSPNPGASGEMLNHVPGASEGVVAGSTGSASPKQMLNGQPVVITPGAAQPPNLDSGGNTGSGSAGDAGSAGSGTSQSGGSGDSSSDGSGGGGIPGAPDPLAHMLPRSKRPPPPASFRVEGNRDLPIVLECRADEILFTPTGRRWQVTDLERDTAARLAFADAVQQWIAKRQATVREGQTPYRPLLRFRVDPDGLRAYYAAYPLLEKLGVSMRRETVDSRPPPTPRVRP